MDENTTQGQVPENPHAKSTGPIVGIVIIIVVLIFGGLYFWGQRIIEQGNTGPTEEEILNSPDALLDSLQTQDASDEIDSIEKDLEETNLEGLDKELNDVEGELNGI